MSRVRLKLHGTYNKIKDYAYEEGEPFIDCYDDSAVQECDKPYSIALMIEPRTIMPHAYEYLERGGWRCFKWIFTHDTKLLVLPNARMITCGSVWSWAAPDIEKTKGISMISSWKEMCQLHKARKSLAKMFDIGDKVDCFGSFRGDKDAWINTRDAHEAYKFAIVIENHIDRLYFTEKLLNCFANKTVPIYIGAEAIGKLFDENGIIQVDDYRAIPSIVDNLDIDQEYAMRKKAIEHNYDLVEMYANWEQQFMRHYEKLLEELQNDKIEHSNSSI